MGKASDFPSPLQAHGFQHNIGWGLELEGPGRVAVAGPLHSAP